MTKPEGHDLELHDHARGEAHVPADLADSAALPRVAELAEIVGVWVLVSMSDELSDGSVTEPFGAEPRGKLIYTLDGIVAVQMTKQRRQKVGVSLIDLALFKRLHRQPWLIFRAIRWLGALVRLLLTGTEYLAYSGRFSISKGLICHRVELSLFPDWQGTTLERQASFDESGRLVLIARGLTSLQRVVWRRSIPSTEV